MQNTLFILLIDRILRDNPKGLTMQDIIKEIERTYLVRINESTVFSYLIKINCFFTIDIGKNDNGVNVYYFRGSEG